MPSAIARAVCSLTAPYVASVSCGTPSKRSFTQFAYVTQPVSNTAEEPGISVMRFASIPPVQDSAVASFLPAFLSALTTSSSSVSTSTPYTKLPMRFFNSSTTGTHIASASSFVAAFAVTRTNISPSLAYGATVGLLCSIRSSIICATGASPLPYTCTLCEAMTALWNFSRYGTA